jgi:molybdenum cofactor cytidylyltransferase
MSTTSSSPRFFAVVPAAGESRRMGRPKLLLPWRNQPVLHHVCQAFRAGGVEKIFVVVRPQDAALATLVTQLSAQLVQPLESPRDMKASIQLALQQIEQQESPQPQDAWFVTPGDVPQLSSAVITRLRSHYDPALSQAYVPDCGGRRAHPALIPWSWRQRLENLAATAGLNQLLKGADTRLIPCADLLSEAALQDLNTPEDYRRLCEPGG